MIDLHLHTTASDGRCAPGELVERARLAGLRIISVTDHDTMAAAPAAAEAAARAGLAFVPGIEITAVHDGKDVHVLGYFLSAGTPGLTELIADQRGRRVERAKQIAAALERMAAPIDVDRLLEAASSRSGKAIARPQIAQALVAAGHAGSIADAFERFLGEGCPAYVPHTGASPSEVVRLVRAGGGIASLAHPGYTKQDAIVPALVDAGLSAIEAYHSAHDAAATRHYLALARRYGLAVSGGSDYHGEGTRRAEFFGRVHLPLDEFAALLQRAALSAATAEMV